MPEITSITWGKKKRVVSEEPIFPCNKNYRGHLWASKDHFLRELTQLKEITAKHDEYMYGR